VAGIVVGPSVLGWVHVDEAVEVIALLGLAFVLFLAGLEIEFEKLRGRVLRLTLLGFAISFVVALVVSLGLSAVDPRRHPAAGGDHPVLDVARGARAGAQGLRGSSPPLSGS
jgi:Kef-type K+ transport system membrane component KefB